MNDGDRIKASDGIVNIGPECFALRDGSLLSWRGQNYVPQQPPFRERLHRSLHNLCVSICNWFQRGD